jgi:hypothetical protein
MWKKTTLIAEVMSAKPTQAPRLTLMIWRSVARGCRY